MPTQTKTQAPQTTQPTADHAAVAAQAEALQVEAEARRAALMEQLAQAEFDQQRAQRVLAALSAEREDHAQARRAREAREAAQAQQAAAQAQAVDTVERYRHALTAIEAQLAPIAGLIAEALDAEDALARLEAQRERESGVAPTLRHTRQRMIDALRVAGHRGGLDRHGEFPHPANTIFGGQPLSAAFSALPAGLADAPQAPAPQALSAHAPKPVDVAMPGLSPDPVWRGSPFDPQPQPASPPRDGLPPPPEGFEPLR